MTRQARQGTSRPRKKRVKKKDRPFYKSPLTMVPLFGGIIALIYTATQLYDRFFPPPKASNASYEYVLDVSRGMKGKLGRKSKLQSVKVDIVAQVERRPNFPAALRLAGNDACQVVYHDPLIWFEENNSQDFRRKFKSVVAGGESNYAVAITHAAQDLARRSKAVGHGITRVLVYVGSTDTCTPHPEREIHDALSDLRDNGNVEVDFKFVGVRPTTKTKRVLESANRDAHALGFTSEVTIATKQSDLNKLVPCPNETPTERMYGNCQ